MAAGAPSEILLVEDNPGDVLLITEALEESGVPHRVTVVRDGVAAMAFLRREGEWAAAPRPAIVLLDLNLPKKNGREVLAEIKANPALRRTPVIVLTGSTAPQDVIGCYDLHANCYVVKPPRLEGLASAVRAILEFWLTVVTLPAED